MRLGLVTALFFSSLRWAEAEQRDLHCASIPSRSIVLDGLLDDWQNFDGVEAGGRDLNLSFTARCAVDEQQLYLLADVRDNYFARTKDTQAGEDHIVWNLGKQKLMVYPGDAGALREVVRATPLQLGKAVRTVSALQAQGWAVEMVLPLVALEHYAPGMPLSFSLGVADCDSKADGKTARTRSLAGRLFVNRAETALDDLLHALHTDRAAVRFDRAVALGLDERGRALVVGKYLSLIVGSGEFSFQELLSSVEVKNLEVVNLNGSNEALAVRYVERSSRGAREILAIYRVQGDELARSFACEVKKSVGDAFVEDKVSWIRRGKATDLVIEASKANGFSKTNFSSDGSADVIPLLLPWATDRRARYQFRGDEYFREQ